MIRETITFSFDDEAQQRRFHAHLKGEDIAAARLAASVARDVLADMATFPNDTDGRAAIVCNMVPPGFTAAALRDAVRHYLRQYALERGIDHKH